MFEVNLKCYYDKVQNYVVMVVYKQIFQRSDDDRLYLSFFLIAQY